MKKSRAVFIIVAVICFGIFAYNVFQDLHQVDFAENAASVSWLPKTASNISYYRSYRRTAYEFNMSEEDFVALASSKGWQLRRIGKEPFTIRRYTWCQNPIGPPNSAPLEASASQTASLEGRLAAYEETALRYISNGYAYDMRQNNGGETAVSYDTVLCRAYVFTTPR